MNHTPQPRIAADGTPLCSDCCACYYVPRDGYDVCEITQLATEENQICRPAVAATSAENTTFRSQSAHHEREAERWKAMCAELEAENERLREACKPLVWRKEPPDKPGWWLRRERWATGIHEESLHVVSLSGELFFQFSGTGESSDLEPLSLIQCGEWAGPIPQPKEPSE